MALMAEDALIAGAVAPAGTGWTRSAPFLDSIWSLIIAGAIIVSSFYPLLLFSNNAAPLRIYVLGLPVLAVALSVAAIIRRSAVLAAVASGVLVPPIALSGSLGVAVSRLTGSPFADAGTTIALGCAVAGAIRLLHWFVNQPAPISGIELRPTLLSARVLCATGVVLAVNVVITALRADQRWSASFVVATMFMLLTAFVIIAAAAVRTVVANALAAAASAAQIIAVVVAASTAGDIGISWDLALRTSVVGLVALAVAVGVAVFGASRASSKPTRRPTTVASRPADDNISRR